MIMVCILFYNIKQFKPYSSVRSQPKNLVGQKIGGTQMCDFRRITLFCLEKRFSKHRITIISNNLGRHGPFDLPWLRLSCSSSKRLHILPLNRYKLYRVR